MNLRADAAEEREAARSIEMNNRLDDLKQIQGRILKEHKDYELILLDAQRKKEHDDQGSQQAQQQSEHELKTIDAKLVSLTVLNFTSLSFSRRGSFVSSDITLASRARYLTANNSIGKGVGLARRDTGLGVIRPNRKRPAGSKIGGIKPLRPCFLCCLYYNI